MQNMAHTLKKKEMSMIKPTDLWWNGKFLRKQLCHFLFSLPLARCGGIGGREVKVNFFQICIMVKEWFSM